MTASAWLVISIILFTLAGALFIAAVIMFFVMNIPGIIGDLSGRTLARGIQNIRSENAYANSKSARAANRRNNPNRQFSIGNEYSKEKGYNFTSLAHASRRLDMNTLRGNKNSNETSPGGISEKMSTPQNNYTPSNGYNDGYTEFNSVPDNTVNQYTQATIVLNNSDNQYTQATTVLNNSDSQYTQATTVLNNSDNQYTQATTVLNNSDNQYTQSTTILGGENTDNDLIIDSYYNEYTQSTAVLSSDSGNNSQANGDFISVQSQKTQSGLPLGFRVVRRVSVTHCNEVL